MANTSQVHKVRHGAASINYVLGRDNKGHNGNGVRNELVVPYNMHRGESYVEQMQKHWDLASEKHTNQALTVVFGFSKNELDPNDSNSPYIAAMTVQGFVKDLEERELLPKGHQMFFAVQKDGKGGNVHVHAVINDVNMITHRGIPKGVDYGPILTKEFQEYCEKQNLFQVDYGEKTAQEYGGVSYTRAERIRREKGLPLFKDVMRERIEDALKSTDNFDDFSKKLNDKGVTVEVQESKKGKRYKFTADKETIPADAKPPTNNYSLRSTSLGNRFSPEAIEMGFAFKKQQAVPKKPSRMSAEEFMKQTGDRWWADGQDAMTAYQQMREAYEEYKRTGKLPSDEEENDTNVPETIVEPVTEEQVVAPVITSDEEESQRKKRKATKSNITVESIETTEKQIVSGASAKNRYSRYSSAVKHDIGSQSDAMVAAVMRKAENIPEAEHDKDRYFGE